MKQKRINRIISMILSMVMVLSLLPGGILRTSAATVVTGGQTVDAHTLDQWKQYFGLQQNHSNQVQLSTEFAGGIWTDKSVFDPADIPSQLTDARYGGTGFTIADEGDNFLVALSAIASNKQVVGFSTIPTDTVLILDLSSSMRSTDDNGGSAVDELVEATNKAINDLLALNRNNRIAVVIYAGNTNKSFSEAPALTQTILPLDSYTTTDAKGDYLASVAVGRNEDYAIEVVSGVKNSAGTAVSANQFETTTGTFMQDGIYEAMRILLQAEPVVQEGVQKGTNRLPIMVLMTDGEPTMANPDYNGNDSRSDLGDSLMHDYSGSTGNMALSGGGASSGYSHRDTIAFLTSLTAAYAKKSIEAHYGTEGLLYTLPYGNAVLSRPEALSVLNPAEASNVQNTLWNYFLQGEAVPVYRYRAAGSGRPGSNNSYSYYYATNAAGGTERLTAADRLYVDKYFPAANDEGMLNAFEDIVDEIIIQSRYYPTYVEKDHDHDGYLTFGDKLGAYMEVTDVKGIVLGDRLFSGAAMAKGFNQESLGTVESPTALGKAFVDSVKTRLGIESTAQAQALIADAFDHGQLSYTSDTQFSHYIGWFSDAEGDFVDFWHEGLTDEQIAEVAQKGATHVIRSYGFLGDTTDMPGINNTDMMYMSVRVATEITTRNTVVTWRIPASLVPTITYDVAVEVDSDGHIIRLTGLSLAENSAAAPIRLLYEVGLRSDITDWNLTEKVDAAYVQENGYTFYSNKWTQDPDNVQYNTYSHFEPSVQNERYYYTQDTVVLTKNGETYAPHTGSAPSGAGYWRSFEVYEKLEDGSLRLHTHYEPITAGAMESVRQEGEEWVIPKDTIHRYYDYENSPKVSNTTATMGYSDHPFVVKSGDTYYTYSTLGNNGKFTVTPATGIRLTKSLAADYQASGSFTFVIEGGIANAQVARLDAKGYEVAREALPASGEVTLAAGETVYIVGLNAGAYTVSEKIAVGADYHVQSVLVSGQVVGGTAAQLTLAEQTITSVEFVNAKQGYGNLVVSKDVNYPAGFMPTAVHEAKTFTVDVTFEGDVASMVAPAGAVADGNTYTLTLRSGESATFSNIKHGVTYSVTERDNPAGYSLTEVRFSNSDKSIFSAVTDQAHVVNAYTLEPVSVPLKVTGTKTVVGGWPDNAAFTVRLMEVTDFSSGNMVDTGLSATVTESAAGYEIDMSSVSFDKVGTYHFYVVEEIPASRIPDMAYDRSYGQFSVTVEDTDADGKLEVSRVESQQNTSLSETDGIYTVGKDFTNVVTRDIVYVNVQKQVRDASGNSYHDHLADITFGLFESMNSASPAYYVLTDGEGEATFALPVSQAALGEGKVYYLREIAPAVDDRVVGMQYDESWIGAFRITWDSVNNVALTQFCSVAEGQLTDEWLPYEGGEVEHTNLYQTNGNATAEMLLSGVKTLNGSEELGGREFSFSLYRTSAAFVIQGEPLQTVKNQGNAITFRGITFNTPGLHYLSVKENPSDLGGITVDERHYHITVLVEKYTASDGTTRLRVAEGYPHIAAYGEAGSVAADELNFNNRYAVTGTTEVVLEGSKTLSGRPMLSSEFDFRLEEVADEQGSAKENGLVLYAENGSAVDGTATFRFAPIVYSEEGTYYYKVTELAGTEGNGVTYSKDAFIYKVVVSDNGQGGLQAEKSVVDGRTVTFANRYQARGGSAGVYAVKELAGKVLGDQQFSFRLLQTEQDFVTSVAGGVDKIVKNNAGGGINFGNLAYTAEGTFYYVIREQIPEKVEDGIVYDTTEYRVTVRVVDDQKGQLQVFASTEMVTKDGEQTTITPVSSVVFYNRYEVTGDAKVVLQGVKHLNGRALADGEFTFELYETDAGYGLEGVTPVTTTHENGIFSFELDYDQEAVNTVRYYVLREQNAGQTIDGVTYSTREYRIAVAVKDNGMGGIELEITSDDLTVNRSEGIYKVEGIYFTNEYDCGDTGAVFTLQKTMTGDKTDPSGFSFGLYTDLNAAPVQTVTSGAEGVVAFEKLTFSLLDVSDTPYVFYIREILPVVDGKAVNVKDNVTYDEKVYTVSLTVSHDGKGNLLTSYTVDGAEVDEATYRFAFTNRYQKPEASTPQTGDGMDMALWLTLLLIGAMGMVAMPVIRKRMVK